MYSSTVLAFLTCVSSVFAITHQVMVGANGVTFSPSNVTASNGDVIAFEFHAKNHSVTQSTFANPCQLVTNPMGIDSGFQPVPANATSFPSWSITVADASAPQWFFCAQTGHCKQGMVFAVNPSANKTFAQFQANAMAAGGNSTSSAGAAGSSTAAASGSASATSSSAAGATPSANSALRSSGSAAGILAIAGLFAGLAL